MIKLKTDGTTDLAYYNDLDHDSAISLPKEVVEKLIDIDELYYGKFGRNWHSNSFLTKLLDDPYLDQPEQVWHPQYRIIGNFVHKCFLEPHKVAAFPYSNSTNRNQSSYKEDLANSQFANDGWMFLKKDYDKWIAWVEQMKLIPDVSDLVYAKGNKFEEPQISTFAGLPIKGKCDVINHEKKVIIDVKTTSDLEGFAEKISMWNYDVQASLYAKALYDDYTFIFLAIDKKTDKAGVFIMAPSQFEIGLKKLYKCTNLLKHFHTTNKDKVFYHYI